MTGVANRSALIRDLMEQLNYGSRHRTLYPAGSDPANQSVPMMPGYAAHGDSDGGADRGRRQRLVADVRL
jgi:hypothetical protein